MDVFTVIGIVTCASSVGVLVSLLVILLIVSLKKGN